MYDLDDTLESDISIDSENWKRQNQMMTANTLGLENILKILLGKVSELESKVEVLEDFKQVGIF